MQWSSPTAGSIASHSVTTSGFGGPQIAFRNLAGSDYSGAPLSSNQQGILFHGSSNWTINVAPSIPRLLWYGDRIRGDNASSSGQPVLYVFDQPFEIHSGFTQATVFANTLRIPATGLHSGILRFTDPISSVTCATNNISTDFQFCTLAQYEKDLGDLHCSPAVVNSTGVSANIRAEGSDYAVDNLVTLTANALPQNTFAFFLTSRTSGFVAMPGGSAGNLCLSGAIGRYVGPGQIQSTGLFGEVELDIDLSNHPQPLGLVQVISGETWNFQCWYRDTVGGVSGSNFSSGLSIEFR